jgi:hypothetical protein
MAKQLVGLSLLVLVLMVVFLNTTPGRFGYADADGCACRVTYTTQPSQAACEAARGQQCDWRADRLLLLVSPLDVY